MRRGRIVVFLDRDGVLNERPAEHAYVRSAREFRWLPGAREAVGVLRSHGYFLVVVSNQRGIGRNLVRWEDLEEIERRMRLDLRKSGSGIDAFYYCPHDLPDACDCRKPAHGLLARATDEHGIDMPSSALVGDSESDIEAGRAVGCFTVRLGPPELESAADVVVPSLRFAADVLLARVPAP